ncbi:hypothetical protein KSS87_003110 [Heliosperma pusillum]|nr:hypothetical protein KSS87_003110 [Heliosperma pusillum]
MYAPVPAPPSSSSTIGMIKGDIEEGEVLYPGLGYGENQLRWGFVRKVYGILSAQLILTTLVSLATVFSCSGLSVSFQISIGECLLTDADYHVLLMQCYGL